MDPLLEQIDAEAARSAFTGVVRADGPDGLRFEAAYGLADRAHGIPMGVDHQLGCASTTKGFTALVLLRLVAEGALSLSTPARAVLGSDLPLVDEAVTVEMLLSHWSGIGDYVDESVLESSSDYILPIPVHRLVRTEDYLEVLDGHPQKSPPGTRFEYCNGSFVILALIAERVAMVPFHDLVEEWVWKPAGMTSSSFPRMDELPGSVAVGYLDAHGLRTNVLHLPVRGSGDGGACTTAADLHRFWSALFDGRLLDEASLRTALTPREPAAPSRLGYGLGIWLHASGVVELHGYDAGVSVRTMHDPATSSTWTVAASTSDGSYPLERLLVADLPG